MAAIMTRTRYAPGNTDKAVMDATMYEPRVGTPQQMLARNDLTRQQKIGILRQWELDLRELLVAEEENMTAAEPMGVTLDDVLIALETLNAGPVSHPVPTTHG